MTLPPVIRIFFALDLPDATKENISKMISLLKKKAKSYGIRWTKPENLHITLQFLAEVNSSHLELLAGSVRTAVREVSTPIQLSIGGLQLFPNPYRPRVIVLEVEPQDKLAQLAEKIGLGITASNYPIDTRPFRAHLTLGRIKQPHEVDLRFLNEVEMPSIESLLIKEVVLFRSEPHPEGSAYSVLERISLFEQEYAVM
jgi:RNA 2',3'-cyclic 3'-phosphodiesterase